MAAIRSSCLWVVPREVTEDAGGHAGADAGSPRPDANGNCERCCRTGAGRVAVTKVGADRLAADFHAGDEDDLVVGQLRLDVCTYLDSENRIVDAQMRIIVVAEHHVSAVGVHACMTRDDPTVLEVDVFDEDLLAGAQRLDVVANLFAVDSGGERQRIDRKRRQTVVASWTLT